ncbi:DUF5029 domain-containing protein [Bacteroides faecalis]|uniref:Fimbrial subunit protein C-terminal domain-containing protein n=1 Tax=Bacteroides faecalis TaxID=2447885 RepID=A0A401LTF6_9BACE|nr:DUF5029 domain-containing protein [Bacteroides faecalis]GCB34794.1 hypothetical protein KGMB02408_17390 [Bacteroides faecalis]
MKVYKLFTLALAALAFAACSDDEVINPQNQGLNEDENWQADVEGLTINFATLATGPNTRAYSGETESKGTEAVIYDAYVFAKEANPKHDNGLTGDWTVIKCKVNNDGVVEGESKVDNPDKTVTLKNVATFHGVRQGDYVYVIANDPNMTLDIAEGLAHQGQSSEKNIKAYTSMLSKEYLGGLAFGKTQTDPTGKFVMAGLAQIPVAPTLPSNGTIEVEVGLDRELSKVNFKANTSSTPSDEAYKVVEFQEGDGITVLRIAPTTSMFTERDADFYVPSPSCVENWPINDHSFADNLGFSKFCDQTIPGSVMFDGGAATDLVWNDVTIPANFNTTNPAGGIEEYRFSWVLPAAKGAADESGTIEYGSKTGNMLYGSNKVINAPVFYTSPNYSKNTNAVTAVCTQATYIGRDVFQNSGLNAAVAQALACTTEKITFTAGSDNVEIDNPLWVKDATKTASFVKSIKTILGITDDKVAGKGLGLQYRNKATDTEASDAFEAILTKYGLTAATTYDLPKSDGTDIETVALDRTHYENMMDKFYTAVILQFRLANDVQVDGDMDTELGNKVPNGKKAYFYDPVSQADEYNKELLPTDYLLLGTTPVDYQLKDKDGKDLTAKTPSTPIFCIYDQSATAVADVKATSTDFTTGKTARLTYFSTDDAFKYFTNMKLYYRADIADYVDNVSNKMTERNMHYQTVGTIQSLGARTIHDAVYSDENTMKVDVKVNNWKLSINQIPM